MRLSRSDYYGLVQSLKCRVFSSIYIKIVPSFKLLKGEFKLAAYPSQCFIQGSISISLTYTHTRTTMQFRKANSWTQTCLGLPNESEPLPWRALSEMHVVGGKLCCLWCDVQPVHIRSRRRKHTAQSHKYQGSPTGLFQAVLNQTPR